jgi:hypothetical protein
MLMRAIHDAPCCIRSFNDLSRTVNKYRQFNYRNSKSILMIIINNVKNGTMVLKEENVRYWYCLWMLA